MKNEIYPNDRTNNLKYLAYVRKSTEEKDRQALSKEAQIEEIKRQFPDLDITFLKDENGDIGESMSAAKPGRPLFNKMIELLESGQYKGIIAWHPDRVSRNMPDASRVIWDIQMGIIDDLKFCNFTFEKTPEGIMMLQMIMSQAQYFSAKLSKDVKRGNAEKRKRGQLTGLVPIGYISISATGNGRNTHAEPDPKRFSVIRDAMLKYLSGDYSVTEIVAWLNDDCCFLTPRHAKTGGKPMTNTMFYKMLSNPRYAGMIPDPEHPSNSDFYHKAAYKPMITIEEYNKIQKKLGQKGGPRLPHIYNFPLKGILTCGECCHAITAEKRIKNNGKTYVYYRCTHKSKEIKCSQKSITEEELARQLDELLSKYTISDELYKWGLKALDELAKKEKVEQFNNQDLQHESQKILQKRLDGLLNLAADGVITSEEYKTKAQPIRERLKKMQEIQVEVNSRINDWYDIVEKTLTHLFRANENYKLGDIGTKRLIIDAIGSDAILIDKMVRIKPHSWVKPIADFATQTKRETRKVRTTHQQIKNSLNQAEIKQWCGYGESDADLILGKDA